MKKVNLLVASLFVSALYACGGRESQTPCDLDLQLFREGIRTESVNGEKLSACYILFSPDSLYADLYKSGSPEKERLQRRTLPNGKHVWNIEDDDTKNLNFIDGCWTVSQRGKMRFKQSSNDNNRDLGNWVEGHYTGVLPAADCPGIRYRLYVRHREHSGDGQFYLQLTYLEADNGKDAVYTYMGNGTLCAASPPTTMLRCGSLCPTMEKVSSTFFMTRTGGR